MIYNRNMNYGDLTDREKEVWDLAWNQGEEYGLNKLDEFETDEAYDEGYNLGKEDGFAEGIKAEQERIQHVLNMMFESALNMGQGNKAVQYKHAMDLLRPISINYDLVDDDY